MRGPVTTIGTWVFLCLATACGQPEDAVTVSMSSEPALIQWWDAPDQAPRVLRAERVLQSVENLSLTHCYEVSLRLPLGDDEIVLHSPHALIDEASQSIAFTPPIHFSGAIEGYALHGNADAATISLEGDGHLLLDTAQWYHRGQRVQVDRLTLSDDWRARHATNPRSHPAPTPLTTAHSALPHPLTLPPPTR